MRNTERDKMSLSSDDERKGIEPIEHAVRAVKYAIYDDITKENGRAPDERELPTIYVVWFAYILGGWKAMLSTSESNGHYYEVTYNKPKGETYLDRYSKDYNEVIPDSEHKVTVEVGSKPSINIVSGPPAGTSAAAYAAHLENEIMRQQIRPGLY